MGSSILFELGFEDVDFCGGKKTGELGEKPSEEGEPTPNSTHASIWDRDGI